MVIGINEIFFLLFHFHYLAPSDVTDCCNEAVKLSYSQPQEMCKNDVNNFNSEIAYSFSQPTQIDNLLVSTQLLSSQSVTTNSVRKGLVRM